MRIIDTHAHLYGDEFTQDIVDVVARAKEENVEKILLPNINASTVDDMMDLCHRWHGFFYPMIGLHPTDVDAEYESVLDRMETLLNKENTFVAIGEVGLDYYWDATYYKEQQTAFKRQIDWAIRYDLPLMIHSRSAQKELMQVMMPYKDKGLSGVFHSFGGTKDDAAELLEFPNFMLGINGVVTFKKSTLPEVLKEVPLERIVLETDAPYLTPTPYRGKRNESAYLRYTIEKLAEIYGVSVEEVAEKTYQNSMKIFTRLS